MSKDSQQQISDLKADLFDLKVEQSAIDVSRTNLALICLPNF